MILLMQIDLLVELLKMPIGFEGTIQMIYFTLLI